MNPKIAKIKKEIEKTGKKIAELQVKLHDLETQKTELENTDFVAIARSYNLTPEELADFLKARKRNPLQNPDPQQKEESHEN